jgi:transposase
MMKLTLSDEERRQLEDVFHTTTKARLRARCQAILMASRGRRHRHIAEDLGVSVRTIQRWLHAYQDHRFAGLKLRWVSGRTRRIPEALTSTILAWIMQGPAGCGLERANWTYDELATYLYQTTGIAVSASTRRAFCTKHGVRPYRPTYQDLKADPTRQETARQELQALKKSRSWRTRLAEPR